MNHNLCLVHNANYTRWMKILLNKSCIQKINIHSVSKSKYIYIPKKSIKKQTKRKEWIFKKIKKSTLIKNKTFILQTWSKAKGLRPMCIPCPMSHIGTKQEGGEVPCHSLKYKQQQQWWHHANTTMKKTWTTRGEGTFKKSR